MDKIFHIDSTIYISVSKQSWKRRCLNVKSEQYFFNKLFSNDKESNALSTNSAGIAGYLHAKGQIWTPTSDITQKLTQNEL